MTTYTYDTTLKATLRTYNSRGGKHIYALEEWTFSGWPASDKLNGKSVYHVRYYGRQVGMVGWSYPADLALIDIENDVTRRMEALNCKVAS